MYKYPVITKVSSLQDIMVISYVSRLFLFRDNFQWQHKTCIKFEQLKLNGKIKTAKKLKRFQGWVGVGVGGVVFKKAILWFEWPVAYAYK